MRDRYGWFHSQVFSKFEHVLDRVRTEKPNGYPRFPDCAHLCKSSERLQLPVPISDKSHRHTHLASRLSRGQRPRSSMGGVSLRRLKGVAHHHHPFVNLNS